MRLGLLAFILTFSAFAQVAVPRKSDDDLTLLLAQQRKTQVKKVVYDLHFELSKDAETFEGQSILEVELYRIDLPLSLDLVAKKIKSVKVNGKELKNYPSRKGSFDIPQQELSQKMKIDITYTAGYSEDASGFQRIKDPADGAEYLYTDFQPYYAHRLFPSFDQPDLKGIFNVTVLAPKEWKVIHNELVSEAKEKGEKVLTTFKPTPPLPTYLFFLGAGPFVEWKDSYGELPLFLYARKSLEQYVDHKEIMRVTKEGLKFFNDYFAYPYPFSKYGHVFIPEFAWGGMENPGAVTLNEKYIFRGPVPQSRHEDRVNLILHEMAHMWFGDLVTMEWWNDLWLNESFATYLASVAQARALNSEATWLDFFQTKAWGYWQDQLITTHSIETDVPDVRTAKGNFDGITYAKGAAALKQLHFFVGDEAFKTGLRNYFKTYAWSNTRREDFIKAIALAAKTDLSEWTSKWLQTAGVNRVRINLECKEDKVAKATIEQKPSVSGAFSPHRTKIAFYKLDDKELKLDDTLTEFYLVQENILKKASKKDCPDFIFPNHEDYDYALFSLDEKSLSNTGLALTTIKDPLTRLMLWNILHQMVRDEELTPEKALEFALTGLKKEENDLVLGNLLGRKSTLRDQQYELYLTKDERAKIAPELEGVVWERMEKAEKASSLQMTFFDFYLSMAQTPASQQKLYDMLVKNSPPEGITLDQDRRWTIIVNLARSGHTQVEKLIEEELKRDSTTTGKRQTLVARAAIPDAKKKQAMWKELTTNKKLTHSDLSEAGSEFHQPNYPELSQLFLKDYFQRVQTMDWSKHDEVVDVWFEELFPHTLCTKEVLKQSEKSFKAAKKLTSIARRAWMEAQDELARCVRVRNPLKKGESVE